MTNRTRPVHRLGPWLHEALAQQADPLHHVCRHIAHDLETGALEPAEAAGLLNAALDAFPDGNAAAPLPSDTADLTELAGHMRSLQRALAQTGLPGDVVMMTATVHAHRCLDIGIERARADSPENIQ